MNHGLNNTFLYVACKLSTTFQCQQTGKKISGLCTAFFVQNKKGEVCLITNRHNVDINYKEPTGKYKTFILTEATVDNRQNNPDTGLPNKIVDIRIANINEFRFSETYENDIACLVGIKCVGGNIAIAFYVPYDLIATEEKINTKLSVCDFVAYPGFPDWYDKLNNNPIFRSGTISSDPRFNYSHKAQFNGECIAYEAFSFSGSSGSPVFAIQKGFPVGGAIQAGENFHRPIMLIGINAGHLTEAGLNQQHSGISFMYKSSAILSIIDK